jgi:hypothetical protein
MQMTVFWDVAPCSLVETDLWTYENAVHDLFLSSPNTERNGVLNFAAVLILILNKSVIFCSNTDLKDVHSFFFQIISYLQATLNILLGYVA